jgi:hypothetical protein
MIERSPRVVSSLVQSTLTWPYPVWPGICEFDGLADEECYASDRALLLFVPAELCDNAVICEAAIYARSADS